VLAVTATLNVASLNAPLESVTRKVKEALVAPQAAIMSAVTTPAVLTAILETVTPLTVADPVRLRGCTPDGSDCDHQSFFALVGVIDRRNLRICAGLPCCRETPVAP
jgi:hypothetical protein